MSEKSKVSFHTLGCRLNLAESSTMAKSFVDRAYDVVPFAEPADVCVINTCTVTEHSDAKNRQIIRSAYRKNPNVCIAVVGCYSQMAAEEIKKLDGVKLVIGNAEKLQLTDYIDEARQASTPLIVNPKISKKSFSEPVFPTADFHTRAHLKVQDGCDFMCTFCIIPFSRGRSRSRTFPNLMDEAQAFLTSGTKEIVLTGVNIGTFADEEKSLIDVVDALHDLPGLERIRISSIEPTTVQDSVLERMADSAHKLVPFLHLPLQSGSDSILSNMRRRHTRQSYIDEVLEAHAKIPDLCVGTDVMVGFPGESDEHFDETFQLLESLPISYSHVFPFSERKGTPAVKMADKIHPEEKKRRGAVLRELSQQKRQAFHKNYLGKTRPVLFERPKPNGDIHGYTDNYIRVKISTDSSHSLTNKIRPVRFIELEDELVLGELL